MKEPNPASEKLNDNPSASKAATEADEAASNPPGTKLLENAFQSPDAELLVLTFVKFTADVKLDDVVVTLPAMLNPIVPAIDAANDIGLVETKRQIPARRVQQTRGTRLTWTSGIPAKASLVKHDRLETWFFSISDRLCTTNGPASVES